MADRLAAWGQQGALGSQTGLSDLLAIVQDDPREGVPQPPLAIALGGVVFASSFAFGVGQKADASRRFAGEGLDPGSFSVGVATLSATIKLPVTIPGVGWIDPAFALLHHYARLAANGSPTCALGRLSAQATPSAYLEATNVADFASVVGVDWGPPFASATPAPAAVRILDPNPAVSHPTCTVVGVDKRARRLLLSAPYDHDYPDGALVVAAPSFGGPSPCFTLASVREGLLGPCLVDKVSLSCEPGKPVTATIEIKALRLDRRPQGLLTALRDQLTLLAARAAPSQQIEGDTCKLSLLTPSGGAFGLTGPSGDPLFGGFQGLALPSGAVDSFEFTIDNRLRESHAFHALDGASRLNAFPYAIHSEGRLVSGKASYRSPIAPTLLAERLSAHSAVEGGGLLAQVGTATFAFGSVAWSPSKSEGAATENEERTLEWQMLGDVYDALPPLGYAPQP